MITSGRILSGHVTSDMSLACVCPLLIRNRFALELLHIITLFYYTVIRSEKLKPEKVTSFLVFSHQ